MSGRIQKEIIDNETYFIIEIDYNSTFDIQLDITDENGAAKNVSDLTKVYFTAKNSISNTDAAALININSSANSLKVLFFAGLLAITLFALISPNFISNTSPF